MNPPEESPVKFDAENHRYYIDDVDGEIEFISVSAYIGSMKKPFDRYQAIDNIMKAARDKPNHKYHRKTKADILEDWSNNAKIASERGTLLHACIENYVKEEITGRIPCINPHEVRTTIGTEASLADYWRGFINFRTAHPWVLKYSERIVASSEYKLAGTPDALFEDPDHLGEYILVDWKCTKPLKKVPYKPIDSFTHWAIINIPATNYWTYCLQLNLYAMMLEKNGYKISRMCVVRFGPTCGNSLYEFTDMDFLPNNIEKLLLSRKLEINAHNKKTKDE
jgi:hypothetical protein